MAFNTEIKQRAYDKRKQYISSIKIMSGCVDCKVWGPAEILSFDHVTGTKEFNIGSRWDVSMERLVAEVAKCEVVCHNCHALRTCLRFKEAVGPVFVPYDKTPRWNRDICITEKIDGTNGLIWIDGDNDIYVGSKNRWITPDNDNAGFARWAYDNASTLVDDLGPGAHRGEWWGQGIQSKYGMDRKVFSLFNTSKWEDADFITDGLDVVPVLYEGPMDAYEIEDALDMVNEYSAAAANYGIYTAVAEGICIFHSASRTVYKITLLNDEKPKSQP